MMTERMAFGAVAGGQQVANSDGKTYSTGVIAVRFDGFEKTFKSVEDCGAYFGISKKMMNRRIDKRIPLIRCEDGLDKEYFVNRVESGYGFDFSGFVAIAYHNVKDMYMINECGQIYSKYKNSIIKEKEDKDGYMGVSLRTNDGKSLSIRVATLVACSFIGYPPLDMEDPTVDHIDGVRKNNHFSNLRWVERGENARIAHVGISIGDNNHFFGKTHSDDMKERMILLYT